MDSCSSISVAGVPGYPAATFVPASHTARDTASLPDIRSRLAAGAGMTAAICTTPLNEIKKREVKLLWP